MFKKWVERIVRNGMVKVYGRYYKPSDDVQVKPSDGEKLLFATYIFPAKRFPFIAEHNAPIDLDGYIRRCFWDEIGRVVNNG